MIAPVARVNILRNKKDFASRGIAIFDLEDPRDSRRFFQPSKSLVLDERVLYFQKCTMDDSSKQYIGERRVQIKDLPTDGPINNLWAHFMRFGKVRTAYQIVSRKGELRSYGFVDFAEKKSADSLIKQA